VGGVVIARYGVNTLEVIDAVKQKIATLQAGLPPGVRIVPFYDRTQLINRATDTLKRTLIEELILVTLVCIVFLVNFRSILVVTIPLPLAFTKTFAMAGATIIAVSLVPVLCTYLLGGKIRAEHSNPVMRFLQRLYEPSLLFALKHRFVAVGVALVLFLGAVILATTIGSEF